MVSSVLHPSRKCQLCGKPFTVNSDQHIQVLHCKRCGYVADVAMLGEEFAWWKLSVTAQRSQAEMASKSSKKAKEVKGSELANRRTRRWMTEHNYDV